MSLPIHSRQSNYLIYLILTVGFFLRLIFFTGTTGTRDDWLELKYSLEFFNFNTVPEYRLAIVVPKYILFKVFGVNEFTAIVYPFCASIILIYLTYLIAKKLFDKEVGLWAGFLMAISPFDLIYASTGWSTDIILSMWMALNVYLLVKYEKSKKIFDFFLLIFSFWMSYRAKVQGALILLPGLFYLHKDFRKMLSYLLGCIVCILCEMALLYQFNGNWLIYMNDLHASIDPYTQLLDLKGIKVVWFALCGSQEKLGLYGYFFPFALVSILLYRFYKGNKRTVCFLCLYTFIFYLWVVVKPVGFDFESRLMLVAASYAWSRHLHIILMPSVILTAFVLDKFLIKKKIKYLTLLIIAGLTVDSMITAQNMYKEFTSHKIWMTAVSQAVRQLPKGSPVMVDEFLKTWFIFKDPQVLKDYDIIQLDSGNDVEFRKSQIEDTMAEYHNCFIVVGGPRGVTLFDDWIPQRSEISLQYNQKLFWGMMPGDDFQFDNWYVRII